MQQINSHLRAVSTNPAHQQSDSGRDGYPSQKVMERLWEVMLEIYGHKWESNYGMEPSEGWRRSLKGITPEMIAKGFDRMYEKGEAWPPSAIEFAKLCRGQDSEGVFARDREAQTNFTIPKRFRVESDEHKAKKREAAAAAMKELYSVMEK